VLVAMMIMMIRTVTPPRQVVNCGRAQHLPNFFEEELLVDYAEYFSDDGDDEAPYPGNEWIHALAQTYKAKVDKFFTVVELGIRVVVHLGMYIGISGI
jgi:hypothetical protein